MKQREFQVELGKLTDRSADVRAAVGRILDSWGYDLEKRSFGSALVDENGNATTDLDLIVFLTALAKRRAVINLAGRYINARVKTARAGELITSESNRHGRLKAVVSNQTTWSFNILVDDMNVMTKDEIGKDRLFQIQGLDGTWYNGWSDIEFWPDGEEEKLFEQSSKVTFKYCVSPSRRFSVYGRPYLLAKVAEVRLQDQERFLKKERKRIQEALDIPPKKWEKSEKVGDSVSEKFWAFSAEIVGYDLTCEYDSYQETEDGLKEVKQILGRVKVLLRELRTCIRASEYAFWTHVVRPTLRVEARPVEGNKKRLLNWLTETSIAMLPTPAWVDTPWMSWRKSKKSKWMAAIELSGMTLRWRAWEKTEHVAKEATHG